MSPLTMSPSLVTGGRSKHNLAISPADSALPVPTPQTSSTSRAPTALGTFGAECAASHFPSSAGHAASLADPQLFEASPAPPPAVDDTQAWAAQVAAWQQQSAQLRCEADALLAALPPRCRAVGGAHASSGAAEAGASEAWVYRYLLHGGAEVERAANPAAADAPDTTAWLLKLSVGGIGAEPHAVSLRLFDRPMPLALSILRRALLPSASLSAESVGATSLVLALPAAAPAAAVPDSAKLEAERSRLPHSAEHLVSLRPAAKSRPAALALALDATPPFGAEGIVVGRIMDARGLAECCEKVPKPAAVRVLSLVPV